MTQAAPVLKFERRLSPHLRGIDYPFAEQTARGVALFSRFPSFTLGDRRIHLYGPWYDSEAANGHFTHGVTSVVDMPRYREPGAPTDIRNIPYTRKTMLMGDGLFWESALRLAGKLAAENPADERIASLRTFGKEHKFVQNDAAFLELGHNVWREERLAVDAKGQGILYPTLDIESTGGWEFQRTDFGLIYRGLVEEAAKDGIKLIPETYGQWTFEVGAVYTSMKQGGTGDPEYLLPKKDFLAAPDPTLQIVNENGAPWPAQADGDALITLCPALRSGESVRLRLEGAPETPGVALRETDGALAMALPGGEFGVYRFGADVPRPYVWPLRGPGSHELTRAFPMENRDGEQRDHPHHRSLWTAFDEVNSVNNWHEESAFGFTRHEAFLERSSGPVFGGFTAQNRWDSPAGVPFLTEIRRLRLYNVDGAARLFDYGITWRADYGDVTFNDTKEAGVIAFRVATSMDGARGGEITNSEGGRGEKECWGRRAAWCDYTGQVGGAENAPRQGIAVFSYPANFAAPPRWHVRDYGLFTANPFSNGSFTGGEKTPFALPRGESVNFDFRVLLHGENADLGAMWNAFQNPLHAELVSNSH